MFCCVTVICFDMTIECHSIFNIYSDKWGCGRPSKRSQIPPQKNCKYLLDTDQNAGVFNELVTTLLSF